MATLVLTTVGTAIGGPVGGAIGALLGQSIDQNFLFAPKARQGPRLGDLAVQTSSYGNPLTQVFGTMRVAGTVIWATDLIEHRATSGGKGQPKTVNYSYSASFAVALSARPIRRVGRIWAEGKLLRGAAGDFKSASGFRLHDGSEDQAADPLIAAAEGIGRAPAFRGLAYAVFEDLQLADFGNRIPSLTFEIEADEGPIAIGAIVEKLGGGSLSGGVTPTVRGYAAIGESRREALAALGDIVPLSLVDDGQALSLRAGGGPPAALPPGDEVGRREIARRGAGVVPVDVAIGYYDMDRDFQAGLQRAAVGAGAIGAVDRIALPAALLAREAKALADARLAAAWAGRTSAKVACSWRAAALRPGGLVSLAGQAGIWLIRRWTLGPMRIELELTRTAAAPSADLPQAAAGDAVGAPDLVHGPTLVRLVELPATEGARDRPILFVAAAGTSAGWRRADLSISYDGGATWLPAGPTAAPAVIGTAIDALPPAEASLIDLNSRLEIVLAHDGMWLEGRDDDGLVGGANLALIGRELIQFGAAEALGGGRYRLSRLLRGRRGTEWAAAGHVPGEGFLLVEPASLAAIEAPPTAIGTTAQLLAIGIGDTSSPTAAALAVEGVSLQPPGPCHLAACETAAGDLSIGWVRRSRSGWAWPNDADTPLGEEAERYRLDLSGEGFTRSVETAAPHYLYRAEERLVDGASGVVTITVAQIGTYRMSRPSSLDFG